MRRVRHSVLFSVSVILLPAIAVCLTGCAIPRTARRIEPESVRQIEVCDRRVHMGAATDRFVEAIEARDQVDQIVEFLGRYEKGWVPVRVTVPAGDLFLRYIGEGDPANSPSELAQFTICPRSIITNIDGKPCGQDMSEADHKELCRIIGLEESFFSREADTAKHGQ